MSIAERLRAHARMLRDQASQLDVEATLSECADRTSTTGPAYVAPMTLDAATSHEPKCDVCGGAKSQCMGVHPEGRWPSC